jgi:hypothetical protein
MKKNNMRKTKETKIMEGNSNERKKKIKYHEK